MVCVTARRSTPSRQVDELLDERLRDGEMDC
jgi:hypothetical protein